MKYVYMNHRIKQKNPREPVIVCQDEECTVEANSFELSVDGEVIGYIVFDRNGLEVCETHEVKAWIEFNDSVEVQSIGRAVATPLPSKPVASEKKPNKKVQT